MIKFTKMHGLGNDFVIIDAINQTIDLTPDRIRQLADRHHGVGCDQLLLVESATHPDTDFGYRIFNAEGGEVAQCGNGARCFARFVRDKGLCEKESIRVETHAGILVLRFESNGDITVNMGVPRHAPEQIPLLTERERREYEVLVGGDPCTFGAVSLGNPHAVVRVADIEHAPVHRLGPELERHPSFPERANIGFMARVDRHHIRLRVYERGAGETLACGSGACAAAVVGIEQGALDDPVRVDLTGGALTIHWRGRGQPVFMTGSAETVFEGEIEL